MNPDDETLKDIRQWYHDHGIEYLSEDWGERDDVGESATRQHQMAERYFETTGRRRVRSMDPALSTWFDGMQFPWSPRPELDRAWITLLEEFFAPYLATLPREKGETLARLFNDRMTYQEAGEEAGITRQGAHRAVTRALQDLTLLIAKDDAWFQNEKNRPRNHPMENRAARRVFMRYLAQKGWS